MALDIDRPKLEGNVLVGSDRRLGFAEFGDPQGRPIFWLHGTPGARRQIPLEARSFAEKNRIRLIGVDRPGIGSSTPHEYRKVIDFAQDLRTIADTLGIAKDMLRRPLNVGFSGGEKKRMEILQMALLEPSLLILDETDSGLDIDALKAVADGVNALRSPERAFLVITHYQRLLDYIKPDVVHVLADGRIVETGGPELALELEQHGYAWLKDRMPPEKVA